MVILTIILLAATSYVGYIFYQIWDDDYKMRKRIEEKERKRPKAMKKAEYDCTENFFNY